MWGHPDRLRWCGYKPVTWPVPSQPGVGHLLSFFSPLEYSGSKREARDQRAAEDRGRGQSRGPPRPTNSCTNNQELAH